MTAHATDPRPVRRVSAVTASGASSKDDFDPVVVEAPLSISVGGDILATTMRTPGHDEDLAVGWLASETDLAARTDVTSIKREGAAASRAEGIEEAVDTVHLDVAASVEIPQSPRVPHLELLRHLQRRGDRGHTKAPRCPAKRWLAAHPAGSPRVGGRHARRAENV